MLSHFQDYFCNTVFLGNAIDSCFSAPIKPQALSFNASSIPSQVILKSVSNIFEPSSYKAAFVHPD